MIAVRWALGAIVAATAVSASADELQLFARLLKRQEPGTPAYNCHDNCGQAIIQGRSSADVCHDEIFLSDYQACLQCSGPDNQDIWKYYGGTLTTDAAACGLSTTPLSGTQPDVGPATPAGSAVSSSSESATETTSEATSSVASSTVEVSTTTEASTTTVATTTAAETSAPVATESGTGYATESATESASVTSASTTGSITYAPTATGTGTSSGNGTATTSSGFVIVTNAANAVSGSSVGFYGALALGALYAAAQ